MKVKSKHVIIVAIQIFLSILSVPGAFVFMFVFDIEMNTKFISASDGSVGSGFYTYLKILGVFLFVIWLAFPLVKLIIRRIKKSKEIN